MKIAFVSYKKQEKYSSGTLYDEDGTLLEFLTAKGLDIERVVWNDPAIDWGTFDVAVLKSPWDYHELYPDFCSWLDKIHAQGLKLLNPYDIVKWNSDKHYLQDIIDSGLPVIPSLYIERDTLPELEGFFSGLHTQKLIMKPCVSASAKNTSIITPQNVVERQAHLHELLVEDSFIIQPFMEEILEGELSFIFLGGIYSHTVIKMPKPGDFRVQHFLGGTIRHYEPEPRYMEAAREYVDQFAAGCLYARVDGLLVDGVFQLMELELIEPYLYLGSHPNGYENYYNGLIKMADRKDHLSKVV